MAKAQNDVGKKEDGAGSVSHKYAVGDGSAPVMRTECCVTGAPSRIAARDARHSVQVISLNPLDR